ncbi:hypothetical protein NC652_015793 [Populus alba x Populus x berolinensis]|nr:hypothetical protein NC652_015793 [Populus alba x Populus x berolinensis]
MYCQVKRLKVRERGRNLRFAFQSTESKEDLELKGREGAVGAVMMRAVERGRPKRERERQRSSRGERDGVDRATLTALILENSGTDTVDKAS